MHGNDEFCQAQRASLLRVCKIPYPAKYLIGKLRSFKDLLRRTTCAIEVLVVICTSVVAQGLYQLASHPERLTPQKEQSTGQPSPA